MYNKIIQYVVIVLGILIIISFIALIYGMYTNFSKNSSKSDIKQKNIVLNLENDEEIEDIEVIDNNRLLIVIKKSDIFKAGIYNINEQKIIEFIKK